MKIWIEKNGQEAEAEVVETLNTSTLEYTLYKLANGAGLEWQRSPNKWNLFPHWNVYSGAVPVNVRFS